MHISEISIRRPVFAWMIMAALIIFGMLSFNKLGVSLLPDVDFPVVSVSVSLPGAAPEVIESQVIDPLEDAIMQIGGIRNISSSSSQSSGSISIEFELDRNIDDAIADVQNRISEARKILPTNMDEPLIRKRNPEDTPIMWVILTSDPSISPMERMIFARNVLFNHFATVPGVGDIALGGYVDPALRVSVDLTKLRSLQLGADDIIQAISSEHVELPAGRIENDHKEFNIRVLGEAQTPEAFGNIPIVSRGGLGASFEPILLKDVAEITEGTLDIRRLARFNGKAAVGLGILKQHGSNAVQVGNGVRARLAELEDTIPKQFQLQIGSDNTRFIKQSVNHLIFMLLISAILTSLVCFLFLGSWTSTLNVLMAIPTSIIGTFIAIYFFGFTLNTFTLLGLSLAIGVVVDDAIMMLENIVRHRQLGLKPQKAAIVGSLEISFAALAATIAVVAIFIPVVFMKGVIGKYFYQFGVTVSAAVMLSLLEALTLTPMRCSRYLQIASHESKFAQTMDGFFSKVAKGYSIILAFSLLHRKKALLLSLLLFAVSLNVAKILPSELMPAQDQSQLRIRVKSPVGSTLAFTDEKMRAVEKYLLSRPETKSVFSLSGGFGGDSVTQGSIFLLLKDPSQRIKSQAECMREIREDLKANIKEARVTVQDLSLRGFGSSSRGFPIEFVIEGPNWDTLQNLARQAVAELIDQKILNDANIDIEDGMQQIDIIPDREKLAQYAVPSQTVSATLGALVGGTVMKGVTEYPKDNHRYPIALRLKPEQYENQEQLQHIHLRNNRGEMVLLSNLVKIEDRKSMQLITRQNRMRSIKIYANPGTGYSQQSALVAIEKSAKAFLPPNYSIRMSGSSQSFRESFQSLIVALLLGILVSYMVLGSQFNSFLHPIIVLLALPFSFSGALLGLYLCSQSLNMYSLIGLILLMGIVKKNSILLVDYTNACRSTGLAVDEALLKACPIRLRPILMTSLATIAGALPEALSFGPGAETVRPMAIALIGGIIASTVLSLIVVPCAYSLVTRFESRADQS